VVRRVADEPAARTGIGDRLTVVVATRNRRAQLLRTLGELTSLPERPQVAVVDNGSEDGSAGAVGAAFPDVGVIRLTHNLGALARNEGVRHARTRFVAFSDDDSWWAPGALRQAVTLLEHGSRIGLLAARTLVGPDQVPDPICAAMAHSRLGRRPRLPGPSVLGFLACSAVLRREAFLAAGGFHPLLGFGAEEHLLALDLAAAGWELVYADEVVAHHQPAPERGSQAVRERLVDRNDLLTAWLRRPVRLALRRSAALAVRAARHPQTAGTLGRTLVRLPAALAARAPLPAHVERQARLLD
jgi:GT2 family glycosyltransferase